MGKSFYRPNNRRGHICEQGNHNIQGLPENKNRRQTSNKNDEDLIIEENTIYEIDRGCYERMRRQRRGK